jgi:hypothetical protein
MFGEELCMKKQVTLIIDAVINAVLGVLLLLFPFISDFLVVPDSNTNFYPTILGGVLTGIAIALMIEALRKEKGTYTGLGLVGAVCINICGGIVLTFWLLSGTLVIPLHGKTFLWVLAVMLVVVSSVEIILHIRRA